MSTADSNGKRALSPNPTNSSSTPSTSATSPSTKRVKLAVEEPVSAPPNLVEVKEPIHKKPKHSKPAERKGRKVKAPKPGGVEEAGAFDVIELLGKERVEEMQNFEQEGKNWRAEAEAEWGIGANGKDVEVRIVGINSHGDGLAVLTPTGSDKPTRLVSVPFTLPSELVKIHVHRHEPEYYMSHGDLLEIIERSEKRDAPTPPEELPSHAAMSDEAKEELRKVREKFGNRVQCRYFGTCSGCQYQPLAYEEQLELKRNVVRRAFANFSKLDPSLIPEIGPTLSSPLEYGYRTKLTPHFQVPPSSNNQQNKKNRRKEKAKNTEGGDAEVAEVEEEEPKKEWEITIGFEQKGRKRIVDIEECVIATKVINDHMVGEREKVKNNISAYKRGATLLLRDSLPPRSTDVTSKPNDYAPSTENHVCITDHHATVREQVGTNEFEQQAGSFFQNNNSILPSLLDYIKDAVGVKATGGDEKAYLVDAYCGSGLFAISLADQFDKIEGVEIDKASIKWAKKNADYNKGEGRGEIGFRDGKAEAIFGDISFPPDQTTVLIDPPRKGCDELFLEQLLKLSPATIIYVSCNPNTQARDIGYMVRESQTKVEAEGKGKKGYWIESARAADLFSQTHHAEGVAILRREL